MNLSRSIAGPRCRMNLHQLLPSFVPSTMAPCGSRESRSTASRKAKTNAAIPASGDMRGLCRCETSFLSISMERFSQRRCSRITESFSHTTWPLRGFSHPFPPPVPPFSKKTPWPETSILAAQKTPVSPDFPPEPRQAVPPSHDECVEDGTTESVPKRPWYRNAS